MSALQSQTFANSGDPYYGNPADWYKFPSLTDEIKFAGTNAVLQVFPAVPDANTTIAFNGNQLAYAGDIPNVADWAQYPANHNVDIPAPYVLNVSTANVSSLISPVASISTLNVSTLNYPFPITGNISTLLGPTISVTADQGIFTTSPSDVTIQTTNGSYGRVSVTANPGQLNTLGGQVNVTANGGNSLGGLYGAVNIVANQGTDIATGITTGGEINITANSGTGLGTATSAININSGGINSYAGFGTPIASVYGYNFINGTLGVSLCASVIPNSAFQVPGTCYLYGDSGITLGSDTYATRLYPYWNGLTQPPNLEINGRTTIAGNAYVALSNVSTIAFDAGAGGAITGLQSINGSAYPPVGSGVTSLNSLSGALSIASADNTITVTPSAPDIDLAITRTPQFSTITMEPTTGIIYANAIQNLDTNGNDLTISQENAAGGLTLTVSPSSGGTVGDITINNAGSISFNEILKDTGIQINPEGNTITFVPTAVPENQGQIVGLSTINGTPLSAFGGYNPNPLLSTITMNENGFINVNSIFNTTANDLNISQENVAGSLALNVSPGGTGLVGQVNINTAGTISFNQLLVGSGIQVNPEGNTLTFIQSGIPADQGQIVGLSTINGVAFSSSGVASLNALNGALSLTATEGTVVITPSSPNINLYVPSAPYTLSGTTAGAVITNRAIGSGNPFPSNTFTQVTEITFNIPPGWTATDSVSYDGYAFFDFSANFNSFWGVSYITNTFATPTDILGSTTNTANALNYPNNQQIYLPLNLIVPPTNLSSGGTITFRIFCNPTSINHYIVSTPVNTAKISIVRD